MTVQFSVTVRNGWLDSTETNIGASPKLQPRTGAQPVRCPAAAIQSAGQVISASSVPVAAAAQFAGWAPVRICSLGDAPMLVSVLSSQPLRTVTEN